MGIVNLFAGLTCEGGGGINGPFLETLGAAAAALGIIAGLGELAACAPRPVSGYVRDKPGRSWLVTLVGDRSLQNYGQYRFREFRALHGQGAAGTFAMLYTP